MFALWRNDTITVCTSSAEGHFLPHQCTATWLLGKYHRFRFSHSYHGGLHCNNSVIVSGLALFFSLFSTGLTCFYTWVMMMSSLRDRVQLCWCVGDVGLWLQVLNETEILLLFFCILDLRLGIWLKLSSCIGRQRATGVVLSVRTTLAPEALLLPCHIFSSFVRKYSLKPLRHKIFTIKSFWSR